MDKKELKQNVSELLNAGKSKSEVFQTFSGGALKDNQLAFVIASHPYSGLCAQHEKKINALVTIMFIQALIAALIGYGIGAKIGPTATWVFALLCAFVPLLFAYGFYKHYAGAYNAFILFTIIQFPKMFTGFDQEPMASAFGLLLGLGLLGYVWYVRSLLFPDFAFISPKKVKGQYVFSD